MGTLGDYIHYHWSNYRKYGTYAKEASEVNNFDPEVFVKHKAQLVNQIITMRDLDSLDTFEKNYNKQLDKVNTYLKKLINNKQSAESRNILAELLKDINAKWDSQEVLDYIINGLEFDSETGQVQFHEQISTKKLLSEDDETVRLVADFQRTSGIHIDVLTTLINRVQQRAKLLKTERGNTISKTCQTYLDILKSLSDETIKLDQNAESIKNDLAALKSKTSTFKGGYLRSIGESNVLQNILTEFSNYTFELSNRLYVQNQIGAKLAEIAGTVIANNINVLVQEELEQAFLDFIKNIGKTSGSTSTAVRLDATGEKIGIGSIKLLDLKLNNKAQTRLAKNKEFSGAFKTIKDKNTGEISYEVKTFADAVAQKADFDIILNHTGGKIGVSMKNTDMSVIEHFEKGMETPQLSSITLQRGTDLGTYLAGIEAEESQLGNHYLQILSKQRGYQSNKKYMHEIQTMRQAANESLSLFLVWSAATGEGQGRGANEQMAQVIAIHDKARPANDTFRRVRFYSIRSLLLKLLEQSANKAGGMSTAFEGQVVIKPSLFGSNGLVLWNDYQGNGPHEKAAQVRSFKVAANARTKNMYVGLTKVFFNNISNLKWQ